MHEIRVYLEEMEVVDKAAAKKRRGWILLANIFREPGIYPISVIVSRVKIAKYAL